jgi:hypothetical protein
MVFAAVYCQFSLAGERGLAMERTQLEKMIEQLEEASHLFPHKDICMMGDFNLDWARQDDSSYIRASLLKVWMAALRLHGLQWLPTGPHIGLMVSMHVGTMSQPWITHMCHQGSLKPQ